MTQIRTTNDQGISISPTEESLGTGPAVVRDLGERVTLVVKNGFDLSRIPEFHPFEPDTFSGRGSAEVTYIEGYLPKILWKEVLELDGVVDIDSEPRSGDD